MPVADLKAVGLHDGSKTAISEEVKEQLLRGQVTDFVRLKDIPVNGEKLDIDTKLSLQRTEEGTDLRFHPIYASEQKHDLLSDEEQQNFKEGVHAKHFSAYGKLLDYGDANYQFDNENKMSFFIRLEKADGGTKELWGMQLKDALQKSGLQKGDHIQVDHAGTKPVRTEVFQRDGNGKAIGSKWEDVRRNEWKIAAHEPKRQREDSVLFEYDRDTKSYVGKNTKAIVAPEEVNGIALTPEQKRKYKEGEQIQLEDGTQIQASPISNIKFNRRIAILSILLDGGLSYLMLRLAERWMDKNRSVQQAYTQGYKEALGKVRADLETKLQKTPNSQKIAGDLSIVKREIDMANRTTVGAEPSINTAKEKVNDPELERNEVDRERELNEPKRLENGHEAKTDRERQQPEQEEEQSVGRKR